MDGIVDLDLEMIGHRPVGFRGDALERGLNRRRRSDRRAKRNGRNGKTDPAQ
jgi:hypothetical protein